MNFSIGFIAGLVVCGILVFILMPKLMIVTHQSKYDYATTISKLEESIANNQWKHKGTMNFHEDMKKAGKDLPVKAGVVKLCKADYAYEILKNPEERFVTCLMPCGFGVWEDDQGNVFVSKMNTGLMGKMFGGTIKKIMGGNVSADEKQILEAVFE